MNVPPSNINAPVNVQPVSPSFTYPPPYQDTWNVALLYSVHSPLQDNRPQSTPPRNPDEADIKNLLPSKLLCSGGEVQIMTPITLDSSFEFSPVNQSLQIPATLQHASSPEPTPDVTDIQAPISKHNIFPDEKKKDLQKSISTVRKTLSHHQIFNLKNAVENDL